MAFALAHHPPMRRLSQRVLRWRKAAAIIATLSNYPVCNSSPQRMTDFAVHCGKGQKCASGKKLVITILDFGYTRTFGPLLAKISHPVRGELWIHDEPALLMLDG